MQPQVTVKRRKVVPHVHVIMGPTGVGKSAIAMALARELSAPIVVADRIQCYVDLPTTSARDDAGGPGRVVRVHLSRRRVEDGDYPADQAIHDLRQQLDELTHRHPVVVVEGGSMSLFERLAASRHQLGVRLTAHTIRIVDRQQYRTCLRDRAHQMLRPAAPATGLLDELAAAWRHVAQRPFVASINGFEAVLEWCDQHGVDPLMLNIRPSSPADLDEIAESIGYWHARHGNEQEQVFARLFTDVMTDVTS